MAKRTHFKKEHGTVATYRNYNCHCKGCREANARYQREYRARKRENQTMGVILEFPTKKR